MELKRAFFKEVKKGDEITKQISDAKTAIEEKIRLLSNFEKGNFIIEKIKLIEELDLLCKEVNINVLFN